MAVTNVNGNLTVTFSGSEQPSGLSGNVTALTVNGTTKCGLGNGTGADQADRWYSTVLTFTASTPQVLDLTSLTSPTGGAVSFARVKRIVITPQTTTDGQTLKLGYGTTTSNAWTALISNPGTVTLQASTAGNNASIAITAPNSTGYAVSSTSKLLQLDPGSSAFLATVDILGASV